ncbi:recombinase family protein [Streptomyces flavusporus]|uniref:recombinase family protein n=1 Tax=Streptomyces flavusporus TaxID=3385496 RepID=UPI003D6631EA
MASGSLGERIQSRGYDSWAAAVGPPPQRRTPGAFLGPGETLVVPSLDRYGRSLQDLINMVAELRERGIGFTSLHENLDTTTPRPTGSSPAVGPGSP